MGIVVTINQQEREWCYDLAMKRSGSMNHADTKNSRNFFKDKPNWYRHYVGAVGEYAYSKVSGEEVDYKTIGKGDKGFDFGDGIDIKTKASEYKPDLILNAIQYERKNPKTYVLVWIRTPKQKLEETEVELVGWIHREDFEIKKDSTFINGDHVYLLHKELLNNFY